MLGQRKYPLHRVCFFIIMVLAAPLAVHAQGHYPFAVLHGFGAAGDGAGVNGVSVDSSGNVYGTTTGGGTNGVGTVFELTPGDNGQWTETIAYSFCSLADCQDGSVPLGSSVAIDSAGNLYGDTTEGGTAKSGVFYELTPSNGEWTETVIHNFCSLPNCVDGFSPYVTPTLGPGGTLYGVSGGLDSGTAFSLTPGSSGWIFSVLYSFCVDPPNCGSGADPSGPLTLDDHGNLYGVTASGGLIGGDCPFGCGTVYMLQPQSDGTWTEAVLHRFQPESSQDGNEPTGPVAIHNKALFGTTVLGGGGCEAGCGTVGELMPNRDGRPKGTILETFVDNPLGLYPSGGVAFDRVGNFYVATSAGGGPCQCGVVFRMSPGPNGTWTSTVLHTFEGFDGVGPAGLTIDSKGNLYGVTFTGGPNGDGVVFEIQLAESP